MWETCGYDLCTLGWLRTQTPVQVLEDASREFQGGPEHALVTTAKADLALVKGNVDEALALLQ